MMPMLPHKEALVAIQMMFEHLIDWPIKSAASFRNAVLGSGMFAINPMLGIYLEEDINFLRGSIISAVTEGRMIDFGFIPNEMIKNESIRSRNMFETGEFQHPFESWLGLSSWEGGLNGYYITPHPFRPDEILVIELYGVDMPGIAPAIIVYDMVTIRVGGPGNTIVSPARMKYPDGIVETEQEQRNRGSNSLDPLVVMLRLLADASIPITVTEAPDRLNRARAKQGKYLIPGHTTVHTKDYIASLRAATAARRAGGGGTHASPTAHWRRAHVRHLADGKIISVRSSRVNWRDHDELHRIFYKIRP